MTQTRYPVLIVSTAIAVFFAFAGFCQEKIPAGSWDTQFDSQGLNGIALALAEGGGYIYAGGSFTDAGGVSVNNIAKWNGSGWSALGTGMDNTVSEIVVSGGNVYAGGSFLTAGGVTVNHIAVWNGSSWSALGGGVNGPVYAIAVDGNDVYAGGQFSTAGGVPANNIAKWNGSSWSALGSGVTHLDPVETPVVYDILVSGSNVYAGGLFQFVCTGGTAYNVARWDGSVWQVMGGGILGHTNPANYETHVLCLETDWTHLYAGGAEEWTVDEYFDGSNVYFIYWAYVYQWNGTDWIDVDKAADGCTGGQPKIHKLDYSSGYLYAGGEFSEENVKKGDEPWIYYDYPPPIFGNGVSQYDGSDWNPLDSGVNGIVFDLIAKPSEVWVGGEFTTAGGNPSYYIGRYVFGTYPDMTLIRVPLDYSTIQEAMDAATDHDTIQVAPGVYNLYASITNNHANNLLILGSRLEDGSNASVVNAQTNPGTYPCFRFSGIHDCTIAGFEIKNGSDGIVFDNCSYCLCTGNYIHDIDPPTDDGGAVAMWNSSNMQVADCVIDNTDFRGIDIWQSNIIEVDHNTILRSQNSEGLSVGDNSDHLTITNNIFAFHDEEGIDMHGNTPSDFTHNYNCFWQCGSASISGYVIGANSFVANPMLVDINNQNYYLQSGSPCLNTGEYGSDIGALGEYTDVSDETGKPVSGFMLSQNFPNPFNPTTVIPYSLPKAAHVQLSVYNLRGEKIAILVNEQKPSGHYRADWDGKDQSGNQVSSGMYLYRIEAGQFTKTRKMLFVR
jgi:hypothetical protein